MVTSGDVDYIDPGRAITSSPTWSRSATQRKLVGWPPDETEEPQPDLADERAGDLGRRHDDHLHDPGRGRVQPAGEPRGHRGRRRVRDRALADAGRGERIHATYLDDVDGFDEALEAVEEDETVAPDIEGVTRPTIRRWRSSSPSRPRTVVIQSLSLPIGAPVPEEYAKEFDAENPSTYGINQVATGPYMIENDAEGELTGYEPGKAIRIVRNPNWDPETDFRPAYVDEIRQGGIHRRQLGDAQDPPGRVAGER